MRTLIVIDGENAFNTIVRDKVAKMENTQAIVVIGKRQNITDATREKMEVVRVDNEHKNSVDFVVVSVVANKMASKAYSNAIIISDDTGFDSAIQYIKSIGYSVRRVGYKEFVRGKDNKKQQLEKMVISCCGYINNHLKNGIHRNTFERHIGDLFGKNKNIVVAYLAENNLIQMGSNKIYFDNKLLSNVASGKYVV